jgi:predicted transcriptional regulator
MDVRKVRRFLDIRQIDVSAVTGLSVHTISVAESGGYIHPQHRKVLERFLSERLQNELGDASSRESGHKDLVALPIQV